MTGPDQELKRLLQHWEAPEPSAALDERIGTAYRQSKAPKRWRWLPVAACILLAVGAARYWSAASAAGIETRIDGAGFRPIPDGAITIVQGGEKQ
jgi:hypothetical protein